MTHALLVAICAEAFTPLGGLLLGGVALAMWWAVARKC